MPTDETTFELVAREGEARAGILRTARGEIRTPVFMPVGTKASVKSVDPDELRALGAEIVLANSYHLHFRPGEQLVEELGGLHGFMDWPGPILTDSGGFQVFSLRRTLLGVDEEGVTFRSVYDGEAERFSPESAAEIQRRLGSDIAMCLDVCPPAGAPRAELLRSVELTTLWAKRQAPAARADGQLLFGDRPGWNRPGAEAPLRRRAGRARSRRLRARRSERGGGAPADARDDGLLGAASAAGEAALLHGHRRSRGRARGDRARHRHVRLRAADPNRSHRLGAHLGGSAQPSQRPLRPRLGARWRRTATARPAGGSAAPTCATSSTSRSCSDCGCSACTTCAS